MKRSKTVMGLMLVILVCLLMPLNCLAYTNPQVLSSEIPPSPDWAYANRTLTNLSISSAGEATATAQLIGYPGVTTEVWIFMYLERYSGGFWTTVDSWYQGYYAYSGTLQETIYVPSGYSYRVKASYYAYCGDDYEHIIQYSNSIYH